MGGDKDDDCDSTSGFSIMSDEDLEAQEKVDMFRQEIASRLKKHKKTLNILTIGTAGVGKSSFLTSLSAALCGHWHEYSLSGKHGDGRPVSFFVQRFPDCGLQDEAYKQPYKDGRLPVLIDLAGLSNETTEVNEELLRMLMYGRLPEGEPVAKAEEIGIRQGVEGLRKKYPTENPDLKVDRVIFLASVNEKIPEKLIGCVIRAARPSGTSNNPRIRSIPVYGVMTKMDKAEEIPADDVKARVKEFTRCLGLEGSEHRLMKCINYCQSTAPERESRTYSRLDEPILRFFRQLVDPYIMVSSDQEVEDFSHLLPPKPQPPAPKTPVEQVERLWQDVSGNIQFNSSWAGWLMIVFGLFFLLMTFMFRSPEVDMKSLQLTCTRVRDMPRYGGSSSLDELPELRAVCSSLNTVQHCVIGYIFWIIFVIFGGFVLYFKNYVKDDKKNN
ncbi:uncharacterized protein LOC135476517 [Liolophura sinensis]|uniref:uncharacterized protein LOC135476517 n=1 Tax=Liolophura sinensis TaxID=3198878 RepID=UPI00315812E3